jgi:hypothetical protein
MKNAKCKISSRRAVTGDFAFLILNPKAGGEIFD